MSRRRKDIASLIRHIERPVERNTTLGVASSIAGDGKTINGQNFSDSEIRDLLLALPYGISSSGLDGMRVQIITNGNQNNAVVGVVDTKRPKVSSGCIIIYDKSGTKISLNGDGTITINGSLTVDGNLVVTGDLIINGNATVNGKRVAVVGDTVKISGDTGTIE